MASCVICGCECFEELGDVNAFWCGCKDEEAFRVAVARVHLEAVRQSDTLLYQDNLLTEILSAIEELAFWAGFDGEEFVEELCNRASVAFGREGDTEGLYDSPVSRECEILRFKECRAAIRNRGGSKGDD